jgi:bacillithiol system protein YtxJ
MNKEISMKWNSLNAVDQLEKIKAESKEKPVLIFKHSTRCNISRATLDRLERNWKEDEMSNITPYFLDLISYRSISNLIAEEFDVEHESPQILIIDKEKSVYTESHFNIDYQKIKAAVKN